MGREEQQRREDRAGGRAEDDTRPFPACRPASCPPPLLTAPPPPRLLPRRPSGPEPRRARVRFRPLTQPCCGRDPLRHVLQHRVVEEVGVAAVGSCSCSNGPRTSSHRRRWVRLQGPRPADPLSHHHHRAASHSCDEASLPRRLDRYPSNSSNRRRCRRPPWPAALDRSVCAPFRLSYWFQARRNVPNHASTPTSPATRSPGIDLPARSKTKPGCW